MTIDGLIESNPVLETIIRERGVGAYSLIKRVMQEYADFESKRLAKQQAIAFDTWKRNNKWSDAMDKGQYIKPLGTAGSVGFKFEKASFDDLYNQFIEQQNKP